jgi:hypothetical protein
MYSLPILGQLTGVTGRDDPASERPGELATEAVLGLLGSVTCIDPRRRSEND